MGEVEGGFEIDLMVPGGVAEPVRELEGVPVLLGMEGEGGTTVGLGIDMLEVVDGISVGAEEGDEATNGLSVGADKGGEVDVTGAIPGAGAVNGVGFSFVGVGVEAGQI